MIMNAQRQSNLRSVDMEEKKRCSVPEPNFFKLMSAEFSSVIHLFSGLSFRKTNYDLSGSCQRAEIGPSCPPTDTLVLSLFLSGPPKAV